MAFVPGCESDVFFSYSHLDNEAAKGDGWVTALHERLRIALSGELGTKADIYRDPRLGGAEVFTPELEQKVRRSATLLAVISPSYQRSEWCQRELKGFVEGAGQSLRVGSKSRAIKVIKKPLDNDAHRTGILPGTTGFDFFQRDDASQFVFEMDVDSPAYSRLVSQLAQELKTILVGLARDRTVYLGAANPEFVDQRRKLERELLDRNLRIVSSTQNTSTDIVDNDIRDLLRQCGLAVIFSALPAEPSAVPSGTQRLMDSELRIAGEMNVRSVVAAQAGATPDPSAQVEKVFEMAPGSDRLDVLVNKTTPELKQTVLSKLTASTPVEGATDGPGVVYLICDRPDHPWLVDNDARHLQEYLNARGLEVKVPLGDDAPAQEFSQDNRRKLTECDAVVLYWGNASQAWFDERLSELRQARGWRRARPFTKWAYLTKPPSAVKEHYSTLEADSLVRQFDTFAPATLDPLVQILRARPTP